MAKQTHSKKLSRRDRSELRAEIKHLRKELARSEEELERATRRDRRGDLDFVPDPDPLVSGAHEVELMEADRLCRGEFKG